MFFDSLVKYCSDRPILSVCQRLGKHALLFDNNFHSDPPGPTSMACSQVSRFHNITCSYQEIRSSPARKQDRKFDTCAYAYCVRVLCVCVCVCMCVCVCVCACVRV